MQLSVVHSLVMRTIDRRNTPTYTAQEASRYLGIPVSTVRYWAFGRGDQYGPLIQVDNSHFLSFFNLVELYVLDFARAKGNVSIQHMRSVIDYVSEQLGSSRPLIDRRFYLGSGRVYVQAIADDVHGEYVSASVKNQGQRLLPMFQKYLQRIDLDPSNIPSRFYPPLIEETVVVMNPNVSSGRPSVKQSGVLVSVIADRHRLGESVGKLAQDYHIGSNDIETAIRFASIAS